MTPKIALVTGASSGIGRATALLLEQRGFRVFGTTRRQVGTAPQPVEMLTLDVRSDDSARSCVDQLLNRTGGRLDVLVNCAGYALTGAVEETTIDEAKAQFETNFFGVVRMIDAVLPVMRRAGEGRIVTIGSLAGLLSIPYIPFYSATKFALEGLSEALWHELKPLGISVTLIEPAFVRTDLAQHGEVASRSLPSYGASRRNAAEAIQRFVERGIAPDEVANSVVRVVETTPPPLRYRVGREAKWLPRLKNVAPWTVFATGVRRRFGLDAR